VSFQKLFLFLFILDVKLDTALLFLSFTKIFSDPAKERR